MAITTSLVLAMGLVATGCGLEEADVVSRSPDVGPTIGLLPTADAAGSGGNGNDAAGGTMGSPDVGPALDDARDVASERSDGASAVDSADVPALDGRDALAVGVDGGAQGEAGSRCTQAGLALCDDFEDGAAGWEWTGKSWTVSDDSSQEEANVVFGPSTSEASRAIFTPARWQDMTVEIRVRVLSFGQPTSSNRAEVYARYQSGDLFFAASLRGDGKLGLRKNSTGLGTAAIVAVSEREWHTIALRVSGPPGAIVAEAYLDGRLVAAASDMETSPADPSSAMGAAGLGVYGETLAVFDDLKVSSP